MCIGGSFSLTWYIILNQWILAHTTPKDFRIGAYIAEITICWKLPLGMKNPVFRLKYRAIEQLCSGKAEFNIIQKYDIQICTWPPKVPFVSLPKHYVNFKSQNSNLYKPSLIQGDPKGLGLGYVDLDFGSSHSYLLPKQDDGTSHLYFNPTQVRDLLGHPV